MHLHKIGIFYAAVSECGFVLFRLYDLDNQLRAREYEAKVFMVCSMLIVWMHKDEN